MPRRYKRAAALLVGGFFAFAPPGTMIFLFGLAAWLAGSNRVVAAAALCLCACALVLLLARHRRRRARGRAAPPPS